MPDPHANFAVSAVATAPSPAASGTSLVLASGEGALFPDPASGAYNCTIWPVGVLPTPANAEIVRVTAKATDTLTITRSQESSSARTVVVGDQIAMTITKKTLTDIENLIGARVRNSGNLTITNNTETDVTFDTERFDTDALHSTGANTERLTAPISGYYMIGGGVRWDTNTTGSRLLGIRHNGTGNYIVVDHKASGAAAAVNFARQAVSTFYFLAAGEYVTLTVYQESGGSRTLTAEFLSSPEFWMYRVGS